MKFIKEDQEFVEIQEVPVKEILEIASLLLCSAGCFYTMFAFLSIC